MVVRFPEVTGEARDARMIQTGPRLKDLVPRDLPALVRVSYLVSRAAVSPARRKGLRVCRSCAGEPSR